MHRSIGRWGRRTVAIFAAIAAVLAVDTGSAAAAVHAQNTWVHGWADWNWGADRLTNVSMGVTDNECNNVPVYVRLRVYKLDGNFVSGTARFNYGGCGTSAYWSGLSWNGSTGGYLIAGVVVHACEDNGVHCTSSSWHDNPYTNAPWDPND